MTTRDARWCRPPAIPSAGRKGGSGLGRRGSLRTETSGVGVTARPKYEARTDIAAVKFTMARVLRDVSFNALHILGSLGTTDLTPIQAMYAAAPTMGIADGVDEVHKATVARRVLRDYRPHEGYWPTEYFPAKRKEAWKKMQPTLDARPELAQSAENYKRYFGRRGSR